MPRKPRLFVPGGLYHAILRGNGRQAIFFADFDRRRWMGRYLNYSTPASEAVDEASVPPRIRP
ncbi:MAG: hypothetical protein V3U60_14815 [Gammaproteobacteria bacterium]